MSSADTTDVGADEDVAWDGFLEVLGLGYWSGVAFFARCSQKLTLSGAGVLIMVFSGLAAFLFDVSSFSTLFLVSWVSGATQEAGRMLSFAQTALGFLIYRLTAFLCKMVSCTLNASGCSSAEPAGVKKALATEALGMAVFWPK
ncbi:hypothetical protein TNCV_1665281 [Trichonephila clavipes]|nr:hypothetical protein TNCV_1665281 [Trichonephila clavipes]